MVILKNLLVQVQSRIKVLQKVPLILKSILMSNMKNENVFQLLKIQMQSSVFGQYSRILLVRILQRRVCLLKLMNLFQCYN